MTMAFICHSWDLLWCANSVRILRCSYIDVGVPQGALWVNVQFLFQFDIFDLYHDQSSLKYIDAGQACCFTLLAVVL